MSQSAERRDRPQIVAVTRPFVNRYYDWVEATLQNIVDINGGDAYRDNSELFVTYDPFSIRYCLPVMHHAFIDTELARHGMIPWYGNVSLYNGEKPTQCIQHAALSPLGNQTWVLDFVAGQFAVRRRETLDEWIAAHPELFIGPNGKPGRALFGRKDEIKEKLLIDYPVESKLLEEVFKIKQL